MAALKVLAWSGLLYGCLAVALAAGLMILNAFGRAATGGKFAFPPALVGFGAWLSIWLQEFLGGRPLETFMMVLALILILFWWSKRVWPVSLDRVKPWLVINLLVTGVCVLWLASLHSPAQSASGSASQDLPSVVLVTVDTLRADHLGCYGYEKTRTEIFDEFAEKGILFEDAQAPAAITAPSHASILTGMTPAGHGVLWNGDSARKGRGVITLADALKAAGYQTAAFVSGYPLKSEAWGLSSGFGTYDDDFSRWPSLPQLGADVRALHLLSRVTGRVGPDLDRLERNAGETTDRVLRWIQTDAKPPFFLWVHYYDPHLPYAPPDQYVKVFNPDYAGPVDGRFYMLPVDTKESIVNNRADFRHMIARYDGEVAFVNDQFARLLGALASRGWRRNTLMVLTADHGETHGEHDRYFSRDLSQHCLHVPLIFSFPEGTIRQGRLKQQVRLIDIAPTVLEFVGLPRNPAAEGVSLMPAILGTGRLANRPVFALAMWPAGHIRSGVDSFALRDNGLKLIWNSADWFGEVRQPPREELYDTLTDPEETSNMIAGAPPSTLAELRKRLADWRSRITPSGRGLSERELQKLRTLGYVQ